MDGGGGRRGRGVRKEDAPVVGSRAGSAGDTRRRLHTLRLSEDRIHKQERILKKTSVNIICFVM